MQAVIDRDRLAPPRESGKERGDRNGRWVIPSRGATGTAHSGEHYAVNEFGDTRMGIGFPEIVNVAGAYFVGQAGEGVWAPAVQVKGYRNGELVAETDWFQEVGAEPRWFQMDLRHVDRIEINSVPVVNGGGWYGIDDLTYTLVDNESEEIVVGFDDQDYGAKITGSGYADLVWEMGRGDFEPSGIVHGPQVPPGYQEPSGAPGGAGMPTRGLGTLPDLVTTFQTVKRGDAGQWSAPPDTIGAIGPNHFVVAVNTTFAIYSKATGAQLSSVALSSFMPGTSGDSRVLFDQHSGRWIVLSTNFSNRIYLAVSTTDDPTGSWFKTNFNVSQGSDTGSWPDYPTLGVDANGIYTSAYMVNTGMSVFAVDKAPLIAASPSLGTVTAFRGYSFYGAMQPAHTYGNPAGEYIISTSGSTTLRLWRVNPPLTSPTITSLGTVSVPGYAGPPDAPALGSSTPLDTVGTRLMMAVYRDGSIWTSHTIAGGAGAAARWYEIDPVTKSNIQSGTVLDSSLYFFFPSIMVNAEGDVAMGFTGSNSSQYAACYYAGRLAGDPPGEMADPVMYKAGTGPHNIIDGYGRNRWGDYSYTTLDPVDEWTFYTMQEYGHSTDVWGTYVAALLFDGTDCDENGIPDRCDLDCGPAGGACDVPGCGTANDCNGNGILDRCESQADCNNNSIQDICDIAGGYSQDCNANGIPDECEPDCNGNGVPDECDITFGGTPDCNGNGVPDDCDISSETSDDCQPNGVPDECEILDPAVSTASDTCATAKPLTTGITYVDTTVGATNDGYVGCDATTDAADVWYRYTPAVDGSLTISLCATIGYDTVLSVHGGCPGTPINQLACNDDICGTQSLITMDVTGGTSYLIRIAGGAGATGTFTMTLTGPESRNLGDCNGNGTPDDCEVDCNLNGRADDCDITDGTSLDANVNGIPDECEGLLGDLNCDGLINNGDIDPFVLALTDPAQYAIDYPQCSRLLADVNQDSLVNNGDIDAFVQLLSN